MRWNEHVKSSVIIILDKFAQAEIYRQLYFEFLQISQITDIPSHELAFSFHAGEGLAKLFDEVVPETPDLCRKLGLQANSHLLKGNGGREWRMQGPNANHPGLPGCTGIKPYGLIFGRSSLSEHSHIKRGRLGYPDHPSSIFVVSCKCTKYLPMIVHHYSHPNPTVLSHIPAFAPSLLNLVFSVSLLVGPFPRVSTIDYLDDIGAHDLLNGKGKIESAFCALQMSGTDATLFPSEGNTAVFKQDEVPGTQVRVHEFDVGETWLAIPPRFAPAIRNDGPQEFCISLSTCRAVEPKFQPGCSTQDLNFGVINGAEAE
ncbi:hypothetical protein B0H13DRAFT_1866374 [Mycena leptocephala]|nr:hypothetical protein B0H13DRAFT_1866374 [Mycena leptocephala]